MTYEDFEEVYEINEEFEDVCNFHSYRFMFPVAHIFMDHIYFNHAAESLLPKQPNKIKWAITTNYIVGMPTNEFDKQGFKVYFHDAKKCRQFVATFPSHMRCDKKIRPGLYKIYKYKDGFCMKRNDRIKEDS